MKSLILTVLSLVLISPTHGTAHDIKAITLNSDNFCSLVGEVNATSMKELKLCLSEKSAKRRGRSYPLYLFLDSGGGSIYDGLQFISFAKTIKNLHTITKFAASMAAAISQGIPGKRYVMEHGLYMFHRARGGFQGQFEDGEAETQLKLWKTIVRGMEQMQADRIGITLADYKKKRLNEWWLYGKGSKKANVSDHVVSVKCTYDVIKSKKTVKVLGFFGPEELKLSACPLVN